MKSSYGIPVLAAPFPKASRQRVFSLAAMSILFALLPGTPANAAPPNSPAWPQSNLQLLVDNDFAAFLGDASNANQILLQNNFDWPNQITNASSIDIVGSDTQTYVYVVVMGGGGTEDFGGKLNGQDITGISGAQFASTSTKNSTFGGGSRSNNYLQIKSSIPGYSSGAVAGGTQNVTLQQLQSALSGASWSSAVATGSGNGIPPNYKTSGVGCGTAGGGVTTGRCWDTPSDDAVVFRYPITSLATPVNPGNTFVSLSWSAPSGGSTATSYVVQYKRTSDPDSSFATFSTPTFGTNRETVTSLTNGVNYSFRIAARNADGTSAYTSVRTATPTGPPPPPTSLSATPDTSSAVIAFTSPVSDGGSPITNYQYSLNGGTTWTAFSPADTSSPVTITGLAPGTTYQLRLRAISTLGNGESSTVLTVITKQDQTISFAPLVDRSYGDSGFTLNATASSGLVVTFQSATPATCTVTDSSVVHQSLGTCTIHADQVGDFSFNSAPRVTRSFLITAGAPTLSLAAPVNLEFGIPTILTATASTQGTVEFKVNGRVIRNCKARSTANSAPFEVTCSYRPATHRKVVFTLRLVPNDSNFLPVAVSSNPYSVAKRTSSRI